MKTILAKDIRNLKVEDLKEVFNGQDWYPVDNQGEFPVLNLNHGYVYIQFNLSTEDYGEIDFVRDQVMPIEVLHAITGLEYDEDIYNYLYKDEGNYTEKKERIEKSKENADDMEFVDLEEEEKELNEILNDLYNDWMESYFEDYFTDDYADISYNEKLEVLRDEIIEIIEEYVDAGWIDEDEEVVIQ